ncbi:MAG: flagellin [Melioribacteraceae bacterium]|nr:MAG: flagellin [Melioribacteraceae bacterium]
MSLFRVNTNMGAVHAYNALSKANNMTYDAQLKLATQKRINSVADDTSGFAVGKSLDQKVQLMEAARNNVGSAKDMLATSEAQLINIKDLVTQVKTKIADSSNPAADTQRIADDIKAMANEIETIFKNTKYNDTNLLISSANGAGSSFVFQTGADSSDTLTVNYQNGLVGTYTAGSTGGVSKEVSDAITTIGSLPASGTTIASISAINTTLTAFETKVDDALSSIGNSVQRLDIKDEFLTSAISNSKASVSRLFDADMAMEQLNATKGQMASQVATSMFSQLNMAPQNVLQLFR